GAGASNRERTIEKIVFLLVHTSTCKDDKCTRSSCHKMKRIVAHTKVCKNRRVYQPCPVCKQFIAICCNHAKSCQKEGCEVPFCVNIRKKFKEHGRADTDVAGPSSSATASSTEKERKTKSKRKDTKRTRDEEAEDENSTVANIRNKQKISRFD
ncbi:hypothetical protein PMAYCL1PPCAC_25694, partial [Pristionchus mayeri]